MPDDLRTRVPVLTRLSNQIERTGDEDLILRTSDLERYLECVLDASDRHGGRTESLEQPREFERFGSSAQRRFRRCRQDEVRMLGEQRRHFVGVVTVEHAEKDDAASRFREVGPAPERSACSFWGL